MPGLRMKIGGHYVHVAGIQGPSGVDGVSTKSIETSEALADGDFVNVWSDGGAFRVRKASASSADRRAHGFVLVASASDAMADVHFQGENTAVTGMVPGDVFLSTTAGLAGAAIPSGSGQIVQQIGVATSPTSVSFDPSQPITIV